MDKDGAHPRGHRVCLGRPKVNVQHNHRNTYAARTRGGWERDGEESELVLNIHITTLVLEKCQGGTSHCVAENSIKLEWMVVVPLEVGCLRRRDR